MSINLAEFNRDFERMKNEEHFDSDLPSGNYKAVVQDVQLTRNRKGDPSLKWELEILNPEYGGFIVTRYNTICQGDVLNFL